MVIGPRGGGDEDEGRFPAGADGLFDRFGVLPRLVRGGELVDPGGGGVEGEGRGGEQDQGDRDQQRGEGGAARALGGGGGDP